MTFTVTLVKTARGLDALELRVPYAADTVELCRAIPEARRFDRDRRAWIIKPTLKNLAYVHATFTALEWDDASRALYDREIAHVTETTIAYRAAKTAALGTTADAPLDYVYGGPTPFAHQVVATQLSRDREAFALLMEQRTGKTKVIIDTAAWLYRAGKIDGVVVIAPNSVKTNWVTDELPVHHPPDVPYAAAYWVAGPSQKQVRARAAVVNAPPGTLPWLVVNVEALSRFDGVKRPGPVVSLLAAFIAERRALLVVDEFTRVKTPSARRTRAVLALGKRAPYRRILSGVPVTQGPLDVFAPYRFLDTRILGYDSFYAFRNRYATYGGWNGKVIVAYQHLDELQAAIDPHSYRILRSQCFDLPEKMHARIVVDLGTRQRALYDQMAADMVARFSEEHVVTAAIVLTQMLRLQQITGGFIPGDAPDAPAVAIGENAKLTALLDFLEDVRGKVIVWARFRAELTAVANALRTVYGDATVVEFHGGVNDTDRIIARTSFQDPASPVRFFVGQTETGGIGLNLAAANTVVYFSNSFSLESRIQSEDRAQNLLKKTSVGYYDIVAKDTLDPKVLATLRTKRDVAALVTGDAWREWL